MSNNWFLNFISFVFSEFASRMELRGSAAGRRQAQPPNYMQPQFHTGPDNFEGSVSDSGIPPGYGDRRMNRMRVGNAPPPERDSVSNHQFNTHGRLRQVYSGSTRFCLVVVLKSCSYMCLRL